MKRNDRVLVSWHQLNFLVPLTKEDKIAVKAQQQRRRSSLTNNIREGAYTGGGITVKAVAGGRTMKQILTNSNGFAKPKEMMAIMGASGSGKTSLLNVLAQRMALSPGYML